MGCGCKSSCSPVKCGQVACTTCPSLCSSLVAENSWNVPACDAEATIIFPGLMTALVGGYISNPLYGTFEITAFNSTNGEMTVSNPCFPENAAPGTVVPALTEFVFGNAPQLTVYETWVPTISTDGPMTITGLVIDQAEKFAIGTTYFFNLTFHCTLAGAAGLNIYFTHGEANAVPDDADSLWAMAGNENAAPLTTLRWNIDDATHGKIIVAPGVNHTLGAGAKYAIQGRFQVA